MCVCVCVCVCVCDSRYPMTLNTKEKISFVFVDFKRQNNQL